MQLAATMRTDADKIALEHGRSLAGVAVK
jgi:hypothetical protein